MPFWLYRVDRTAQCYRVLVELADSLTLWGNKGAVARCAGPQLQSGGATWEVTENMLLADLLPRISQDAGSVHDFAISLATR